MTKKRPEAVQKMFSLSRYLYNKAQKRLAKAHHRQEKRDAKVGETHTHNN